MAKNNRNNDNGKVKNRLQSKNISKFFGKLALITFIPVFIIVVLLSIALKGQHGWILWLVTAVLLIISFSISYHILIKREQKKMQEKQTKNKGKKSYNSDDIDIYS